MVLAAIHAVDKLHNGKGDASVMYIPACPLTEANAEYLVRQREAFAEGRISLQLVDLVHSVCLGYRADLIRNAGIPAPDFPSGEGEGQHIGRLTPDYVMQNIDLKAQQAMGLSKWNEDVGSRTPGEARLLERANEILGF